MPRLVTLVLVRPDGTPVGALPEFGVPTPWLQQVDDVVAGARRVHGIDVTVLRLLSVAGERVRYLAECAWPPAGLSAIDVDLAPDPRRAPYAEPGGPAASLAWARSVHGDWAASQVRTWNLSAIWRLERGSETVWLKQVPHFFGHEAAVLRLLPARVGPRLLADDAGRMLLADAPGEDRYGAPAAERIRLLDTLHDVQRAVGFDAALAAGVPDRRTDALAAAIRRTVHRYGDPALLTGLDDRLAALDRCGLPPVLVHGDFHPGNVRGLPGDPRGGTIIDWGDSFVGHPGFDVYRMTEKLDDPQPVLAAWCARWRATVPGCEPERALDLLRPLVALRNAAVYATFLEHIEPAEHVYHRDDVGYWLDRAAALAG